MPNVCDYSVSAYGPQEELRAIVEFLTPAISPCAGGYYASSILEVKQLFMELDKREHTWIGLNPNSDEHRDCFSWDGEALEFSGACKTIPPEPLLSRLSERFPNVTFRCIATTEHEEHDTFEVRNGVTTILDHCIDDIQGYKTVWYCRDGQKLDPPLIEHHPKDELDEVVDSESA